ncbi:MAG: DUF5686 family protein [Bacteroides sp.]|nr:DUF5686 family protein [Bacteroides sp.]
MKRLVCILLINFCIVLASAQTFRGIVKDDDGNPVPYASLYLREIQSGVTTDEGGCFQLKLEEGTYTCEVSSLGFVSQTFTFRMTDVGYDRDVTLVERTYSLPEVSVTKKKGEDPAYDVMRRAIARAEYHRTQVKSYTVGTYLKGTGKGISIPAVLKLSKEVRTESKKYLGKLFVLEEQQVITYTAPNQWDNRILARRNSFPEEMDMNLDLLITDLYTPELFDKVSPLSTKAFTYYRFRLDACYEEAGRMINKIRVIPKRDDRRLIVGDLFIVEDLWCISALDIDISGNGIDGKVKILCKEVKPDVFLPTSTTASIAVSLMGFKAEASYLSAMHYSKVITDSRELPVIKKDTVKALATVSPAKKRKYERRQEVSSEVSNTWTDSLASLRDSAYWDTVRSVPLRAEELLSYQRKASDFKEIKLRVRTDSVTTDTIRTHSQDDEWINDILASHKTFRSKNRKAWVKLPSLLSVFHDYNFVDGFSLGYQFESGVKLSSSSTLSFSPAVYYTTARHSWMGQGELSLSYAPFRAGKLSVSGGVLSADYNGTDGELRQINAVASSLFGHNHIKFYEQSFLSVKNTIEPFNGVVFSSALSWQRREMLDNHVQRSWLKREVESNVPRNEAFRPMPGNKILKATFALQYTPARYYHLTSKGRKVYEDSRYPTLALSYERAFPVQGDEYLTTYHKMQFLAWHEWEFGVFNRFCWSAQAGIFWGANNLQFPDFKQFASTRIWVTGRSFDSGFSLRDNYALATDTRWAQANASWYTPYLLLKWLPFLSKKPFDEALHLRSVVTYRHVPYTEAGYSLGFSDVGRIGVFAGFDNLKLRSIGFSVSLPILK